MVTNKISLAIELISVSQTKQKITLKCFKANRERNGRLKGIKTIAYSS